MGMFEDERVELLRGALVAMTPQKPPHASTVAALGKLFERSLGDRGVVRQHSPLALSEDSEPEPDIALVPLGDYSKEHPTTAFLVIEVADSSLRKDREVKAAVYAEAKIAEYWIVNLVDRVLEVYRGPKDGRYGSVTNLRAGADVSLVAFPDVMLPVNAIVS